MSKTPSPSYRQRRHERGFTLIELLVVLVILGLLAALATPQVLKYLGTAKSDVAATQISNLASILDLYRLEVGRYPSEHDGLAALIEAPADATRWNGPYIAKADALQDPWGAPYGYRQPGQHGTFDLYSLGADQAEGGDGEDRDVTSW